MTVNSHNLNNDKKKNLPEEQRTLLNKLRNKVDSIDNQIVKLLLKRFKYSVLIGKIKKAAGMEFYSPEREAKIIEGVKEKSSNNLFKKYLSSVYERIIDVSRGLQRESDEESQKTIQGTSQINFKELLSKKELYFIIGIFLSLCVLFYYTFFTVNPIKGETPVVFVIENGMPLGSIIDSLYAKGVIPGKFNMRVAAFLYGAEKRIKAARYKFTEPMSYLDLLDILIEGKGDQLRKLKFYNGIRPQILAARLHSERIANRDSVLFLINNKEFIESLGLDVPSLEGYLLPKNYKFYENSSAREVLSKMYYALNNFLDKKKLEQAHKLGYPVHKVLTMASIIEGETNHVEEMPRISGVYYNRLRIGMKLQADPTIQYLQKDGYKRLKFSDLNVDSPYNTYKYFGLPPGPINNPGKEAILAALYPEKHQYIFFVAEGNTGKHKFSKTYSEHLRLAREYYKWLNTQKKK